MGDRPYTSPWGKPETCRKKLPGVYEVFTCSHGGIMVSVDLADEILSPEAEECGFVERGYFCFEEDCAAAVVIRELLDKHMWKIPKSYPDNEEAFVEMINQSLIHWYPEYWESRSNKT